MFKEFNEFANSPFSASCLPCSKRVSTFCSEIEPNNEEIKSSEIKYTRAINFKMDGYLCQIPKKNN